MPRTASFTRLALACAALALVAPPLRAAEARRARLLMGTTCSVEALAASPVDAEAAADGALDEIARQELLLSTWRPDAEMARANRELAPGPAILSPELALAVAFALDQARRTGGAFDPSIGALVDAWDLRGAGRVPSPDELARARAASGHAHLRLDAAALRLASDAPGLWLDTGGFGKGLALDAAAAILRERHVSAALLDFGGQILAFGSPAGERGWEIGVADPRERERPVLAMRIDGGSASTSAQSERSLFVAGRRVGHVLDPRSGLPVSFAGSVTVVAPTAAEADALSTALLVMGVEEGLRFARAERLCAGFLVPGRDLELRATPSFLALVQSTAPDVRIAGRGPLMSVARSAR